MLLWSCCVSRGLSNCVFFLGPAGHAILLSLMWLQPSDRGGLCGCEKAEGPSLLSYSKRFVFLQIATLSSQLNHATPVVATWFSLSCGGFSLCNFFPSFIFNHLSVLHFNTVQFQCCHWFLILWNRFWFHPSSSLKSCDQWLPSFLNK